MFISHFATSQDLKDKFISKVCDCFKSNIQPDIYDINLLGKCFDFSSEQDLKIISEHYLEKSGNNIDSLNYVNGYKTGQQLFNDLQKPLIFQCNSYYNFVLESKKAMLENLTKEINEQQADSLNQILKNNKITPELMWEIGIYELSVGNIKKAKLDFIKSLEINPQYIPANFFLAIVYEKEENYNSAIKYYEKLIEQKENSLTPIVKMFLGVAQRRNIEKE